VEERACRKVDLNRNVDKESTGRSKKIRGGIARSGGSLGCIIKRLSHGSQTGIVEAPGNSAAGGEVRLCRGGAWYEQNIYKNKVSRDIVKKGGTAGRGGAC